MYKKHIILGIGIGIFFSAIVFLISFKIYEMKVMSEMVKMDVTDEYIIDRATEMGMIFFDNVSFKNDVENTDGKGGIELAPESFVLVSIPKNSTAIEIAEILYAKGLVEDKVAFTNTIINANLSRSLRHGDFLIPTNVTSEELLDILT